jgi:hypothetical protein
MKVNHVKTAAVGNLLVLAGLAVILLPAYAGDPEPIARPVPKRQGVHMIARPEPKLQGTYEVELTKDDQIAKATLEEDCGAAIAMGYSKSFSFDEAFKNAIDALPEDTTPAYPDKMTGVRVIDIGATFGGFTGVAQMYVRVQRAPDPACLSAKEQQGAEPNVGKIRMHLGKVKKLPDQEVKIWEVTKPKPIEEK